MRTVRQHTGTRFAARKRSPKPTVARAADRAPATSTRISGPRRASPVTAPDTALLMQGNQLTVGRAPGVDERKAAGAGLDVLPQAPRSVLGDHVKNHLLRAILSGRFAPGSRVVETQVARELGVSQSPVREALRDLAALGIVEMSAFRGARVRRPTLQELLDAFVVRAELEIMAVRLAFERVTDADIAYLSDLIEQMKHGARANDLHAETVADVSFHLRLIQLAGNKVLERAWQTTEPFSRTYITMQVRADDPLQIAHLHPPVLEAARARDVERAVAAIREHFEQAANMIRRAWASEDGDVGSGQPTAVLPARTRRDER